MMKLHQALCLVSLYLTGQNVCATSSMSTSSDENSTITNSTSIPTTTSINVATSESTVTISGNPSAIPTSQTSSINVASSAITSTAMTRPTDHSSVSTAEPTREGTTTPLTFTCITHTCFYKGCLTNDTVTNAATANCTGKFCTVVQSFNETSYSITAGCNSTCENSDQAFENFKVRTRCCQGTKCNKDDPGDAAPARGNGGLAIRSAPFCFLYIFLVLVGFIKS